MELFLQNCEVSALLVRVERPGAGGPPESRRLAQPYLLVGRDARNDVRLDDEQVSRRHAYLQAVGGRLYCVDLDSRTGVHWPGGPRPSGWVGWDEPLRIGGHVLRVSRPRTTALITSADAGAPPASPETVFEVVGPEAAPLRWCMRESLALAGGAAACKVRLRHGQVSRYHCALVRGRLGVWMVDLLSREGTRVNGRVAPWARLTEGDGLEAGPFLLRLWHESRSNLGVAAPAHAAGLPVVPVPHAAPAPLDQSLLLPVVTEFNRMQQQMLDQFHQTMLMMAEMFTTLHREQSELVREELDHLRQLTRELNALQAERARVSVLEAPAAPLPRISAASAEDLRPEETAGAEASEGEVAEKPAEQAPKPAPTPAPTKSPAEVHEWLTRRIDALQAERQGRWQKLLQKVMGL